MFVLIWVPLLFTLTSIKADTAYPEILNSSGCVNQSEALTCMCISRGFPLPTIKWPLLENHSDYSVLTSVSDGTVNSTMILVVKDQSNTAVECVSRNGNTDVKSNLIINQVQRDEGEHMKLLRIVTQLEVIIAFCIGTLLSAVICCLVRGCRRKKTRTFGNLPGNFEMGTSNEIPLMVAGQSEENDPPIYQEAADGGALAAVKSDVEYSNLDFSQFKRDSPAGTGTTQETTESEYAEIKKEKAEEIQEGEDKREEMAEENEDEETKRCEPDEKEGGEGVALYSNVKDDMGFGDSDA